MNKATQGVRSIPNRLAQNARFRECCLGLAIVLLLGGFFFSISSSDSPQKSGAAPKIKSAIVTDQVPAVTVAVPVAVEDDQESPEDKQLNALFGLESGSFDAAAPQILIALKSPFPEVRRRAVDILISFKDDPAVLTLVAIAQKDTDAEVRRRAIEIFANSELKTNLTPYLLSGAEDSDETVRATLIQTLWSLNATQRDEFIDCALLSSGNDVSSACFEMLNHERSKTTVQLLLNVYATNNSVQIHRANEVMSALVDQTFSNATEASAWWQAHQGEYQDDLSQVVANSDSSNP